MIEKITCLKASHSCIHFEKKLVHFDLNATNFHQNIIISPKSDNTPKQKQLQKILIHFCLHPPLKC